MPRGVPKGSKEKVLHPKDMFDKRSFRYKKVPGQPNVMILIGCPKGFYNARTNRCKIGTRAHKIVYKPGYKRK